MQSKNIIINIDGIKLQVLQIRSKFCKSHVEEVERLGQQKVNVTFYSESDFIWASNFDGLEHF